MSFNFQGKVAIVTGGTSGIGRATALAFAQAGAQVVVAGRREAEGAETVRLIQAAGGKGLFVKTDVSREADIENLVAQTVRTFGRLDFAFNNAGLEEIPTSLLEQTEAAYNQIMDVNVKGVFFSMKHEIAQILKSGGGAVVNNSSIAGLIGAFPGVGIYVASKHAVSGMTKTAALEFSKQGVRVNAVCPAAIETDMLNRFAGEDKSPMAALHPIGRIGKAEEIAQTVLFLCSDGASFITGQNIAVDGGFTAQ
ncbi:MAG: SDR family oxidoreductase [Blastocatellia bacterium]|nr:SDR family oxidoreductase [Blastocatellia bacterium]